MGDERFERILEAHGPGLRRLAEGYAAEAGEQEDLFQETLFAIWRALPSFRGECSERTFAFRIGHNRGISHLRRRRPDVPLDAARDVPDPAADPALHASLESRRDRLLAAVRTLPDGQRQAVLLVLEGFGQREIAEMLGVTENNVAVRLSRAREGLRQRLGNPDR